MTIDWTSLNDTLPTDTTVEQKEKRHTLFRSYDPNGNGYLSLAECDKGLKETVDRDLFPSPVIRRAFFAANGIAQQQHHGDRPDNKLSSDFIEFSEFRLFLVYLKRYLKLWEIFADTDTEGDRRINFDEFQKALPKFAEWGVSVNEAEQEFKQIDTNGGGQILFVEFADWGLKKTLSLMDKDSKV